MQSGEHDPSVSDRPDQPALIERVYAERDTFGSSLDYVHELITRYSALPEHRANMLQLQRMARTIVNPTAVDMSAEPAISAFYWGEVLGYSTCHMLYGDDWTAKHWHRLNGVQQRQYEQTWNYFDDPAESTVEYMSEDIKVELDASNDILPVDLEDVAEQIAIEISNDPEIHGHMLLGFRHIMLAATQRSKDIPEFDELYEEAPVEQELGSADILNREYRVRFMNAEYKTANIDRQEIMNIFFEACEALNVPLLPENDQAYLTSLQDLMMLVNKRIMEHPVLRLEQEYTFSGTVLAATYSKDTPRGLEPFLLNEKTIVEGSMGPVYILEGPSESMVGVLQNEPNPSPEMLAEHATPYCVLLEINSAVIQQPKNPEVHQPKQHDQLFIVLGNEQLHMTKLVL
jgi:hypothetical protein